MTVTAAMAIDASDLISEEHASIFQQPNEQTMTAGSSEGDVGPDDEQDEEEPSNNNDDDDSPPILVPFKDDDRVILLGLQHQRTKLKMTTSHHSRSLRHLFNTTTTVDSEESSASSETPSGTAATTGTMSIFKRPSISTTLAYDTAILKDFEAYLSDYSSSLQQEPFGASSSSSAFAAVNKQSFEKARILFYRHDLLTFHHEDRDIMELQENLLGFFFYVCIIFWYIQIIAMNDDTNNM